MTTTFQTRDEVAAERIRGHHAHMVKELEGLVSGLAAAGPDALDEARADLVQWLRAELAPHAAGEERTFYPAAGATSAGELLIRGMVAEHGVILGLLEQVEQAPTRDAAAAWAGALLRVFRGHADKENDLVLPLLVAETDIDLADLLEQMHAGH